MTSYDKAKEVADKLRAEKTDKEETEKKEIAQIMSGLDYIKKNAELAKMYGESARVGADNLAGELPLLKVHQTGKSTKNEMDNDKEPNDGWFFYKPTREQYETVNCHILTISKGFRAEGIDNGQKKIVFNQLIGGTIIDNGELKPFLMYMTGLKLSPMWEFGKIAGKYTRMKPIPIPMFALTVKLTTRKVDHSYGRSWIIDFDIVKDESGHPVLVNDPGEFQFLKDSVEPVEDTIAGIVEAKEIKTDTAYVKEAEEVFTPEKTKDIPF